MSIVNLNSEAILSSIVESMLPRFSDNKLGLTMTLDMGMHDFGYGSDGNTRERRELSVRRSLSFLFHRPSNYTKVFYWEPEPGSKGLKILPGYAKEPLDWYMLSDHDSCWRDAIGSKVTDVYFQMAGAFKGRKRTGVELRPCDISQHNSFWSNPSYVLLDVFEQKDKKAERYSKESRVWNIHYAGTDFSELQAFKSPDTSKMASSGLLVKGSEDFNRYQNHARICGMPIK